VQNAAVALFRWGIRIRRALGGRLPVDVLRVEQSEGASGPSTRVTVGKRLGKNLLVALSVRQNAAPDQNTAEVRVEYRVTLRWLFEAVYGDRGALSADLLRVWRW
jgi:hypothetical protein